MPAIAGIAVTGVRATALCHGRMRKLTQVTGVSPSGKAAGFDPAIRRFDENAGSVFEQRAALAPTGVSLREEANTKNAGSVFEQRAALAPTGVSLREEANNPAT
jgi:hypothetical protein